MDLLINKEIEIFIERLNKIGAGKWVILNAGDSGAIGVYDEDISVKEYFNRTSNRIWQIKEFIKSQESEILVVIKTEWGYDYTLLLEDINDTELFDTKEAAQLVYECNKGEY